MDDIQDVSTHSRRRSDQLATGGVVWPFRPPLARARRTRTDTVIECLQIQPTNQISSVFQADIQDTF